MLLRAIPALRPAGGIKAHNQFYAWKIIMQPGFAQVLQQQVFQLLGFGVDL